MAWGIEGVPTHSRNVAMQADIDTFRQRYRELTKEPNLDELVASSVIRPPLEAGDPTEGWPDIRLPAGTGAELIDAGRGDA